VNLWCDTAKIGVSSGISQDINAWFSKYFHRMKALLVYMIDLDLLFRFLTGRGHGNQIWGKIPKWP